jgi:hypothetical protein
VTVVDVDVGLAGVGLLLLPPLLLPLVATPLGTFVPAGFRISV